MLNRNKVNKFMRTFSKYGITFFLAILLNLLVIDAVRADHNQHLFETANKLFEEKKYAEAIPLYQEIIKNEYESWQVYYNLGNACYKTGQFGRAILNYERAMKLNPENEDLLFNLELANLTVVDKVVEPPKFLIDKIVPFLKSAKLWNVASLAWFVLGIYFLATVFIILKIFMQRPRVYRLLNFAIVPLVIILIVISALFMMRLHGEKTSRFAIVLEKKVDVLGSPDDQGTELFALHEGVKIKVEDFSNDWAKIRLADGKIGWLKKSVFEII